MIYQNNHVLSCAKKRQNHRDKSICFDILLLPSFYKYKSINLYLKSLNFRQRPESQADGANHIIERHGAEAIA